MNRKLLAAVVSGAMALPMASSAQDTDAVEVPNHSHPSVLEHEHELGEGEEKMMVPMHAHQYQSHPAAAHGHDELHGHSAAVYGSLRYGVTTADANDSRSWTIGGNHGSRFGVKGTAAAGAGLTAGFQIERALNAGLTPRHHNVSLSGDFGTATFGQHGSPYYSAVTWDGSNQLGGATDFGLRRAGVSFSSSLGGPFSFSVFAGDGGGNSGADHLEATGSLAAGPISLNVAYMQQVDEGDRIGGTVGGAMAGIDWEVGYEAATDVTCTAAKAASTTHTPAGTDTHVGTAAMPAVICDEDRYGFHVGYTHGAGPGGGTAFVQYGNRDSDVAANDLDYWVFGYSYYVSTAVTVQAAHRLQEVGDPGADDSTSVLVLKVDF